MENTLAKQGPKCEPGDTLCLDVGDRPLLANIRSGLIDPDTPKDALKKTSADGKEWTLVVSDERLILTLTYEHLITDSLVVFRRIHHPWPHILRR